VLRPTRAQQTDQPAIGVSTAEQIVRAAEQRQRGEITDDEYLVKVMAIATFA
jgi:uncharacterized membrane protein